MNVFVSAWFKMPSKSGLRPLIAVSLGPIPRPGGRGGRRRSGGRALRGGRWHGLSNRHLGVKSLMANHHTTEQLARGGRGVRGPRKSTDCFSASSKAFVTDLRKQKRGKNSLKQWIGLTRLLGSGCTRGCVPCVRVPEYPPPNPPPPPRRGACHLKISARQRQGWPMLVALLFKSVGFLPKKRLF